jgi:hypothetical protein
MPSYGLRGLFLALLLVLSLCVAQTSIGQEVSLSKVAGTWKLVLLENLRPNGEVVYESMGRHPVGLMIYDPTGHVSVQVMRDPRPATFGTRGPSAATPEEIDAAFRGYYAHFGTYEVNEKEGTMSSSVSTILHHVEASLLPDDVGTTYKRQVVEFSGDRMIQVGYPYQWDRELRVNRWTWERVK